MHSANAKTHNHLLVQAKDTVQAPLDELREVGVRTEAAISHQDVPASEFFMHLPSARQIVRA
jgi:hypothetical protein